MLAVAAVVLVVVAGVVLVSRWRTTPRDMVGDQSVYSITTDGDAVYAATDLQSGTFAERRPKIHKFNADGDRVWAIEPIFTFQPLRAFDDALWAVLARDTREGTSDRGRTLRELVKLDANTGEIVASADLGDYVHSPFVHDNNLWVIGAFDLAATVLDPDTLDTIDTVDLRAGGTANPPIPDDNRGPLIDDPYVVGDSLYYILNTRIHGEINWFVEFSLTGRRVVRETRLDLGMYRTDLIEDKIWLYLRDRDESWLGPTKWRVVSIDLAGHEVSKPMPFLDSPFDSVVTDDYIFDLVGQAETVQIDRATGEIIHRFDDLPLPDREGHTVTPEFVINDHLWFSDLSRRKIATPD